MLLGDSSYYFEIVIFKSQMKTKMLQNESVVCLTPN